MLLQDSKLTQNDGEISNYVVDTRNQLATN